MILSFFREKAFSLGRLLLNFRNVSFVLLLIFFLLPFQKRMHGPFQSLSKLLIPEGLAPPSYFSTKIHFYLTDFLILFLAGTLLFKVKISLRQFFWEGPSKYLTFFFFASFLSIVVSINNHYLLQYLRLFHFSIIILLFNSICCSPNEFLTRNIKTFAWILVAMGSIEGLMGAMQYMSQHSLGLSFLGEVNVRQFDFHNPAKSRWILSKIFGETGLSSDVLCRASGTFTHPNILGGFLSCSLLATFYLYMKESTGFKRWLFASVLLQMLGLCVSFSRSAILAFILGFGIWFCLQLKLRKKKAVTTLYKMRSLLFVILGAIILCLIIFLPPILARGGILNYNQNVLNADSERVIYQKISGKMISDHPLFGVGFNNFQFFSEQYKDKSVLNLLHSKVHNIYLLIASETGLISLCCFSLFLMTILVSSFREVFKSGAVSLPLEELSFLLSAFCGMLFIGLCDFYVLHTSHGRILFFGTAGFLYAISRFCYNKRTALAPLT